jgi:restriction system protein
MVALPPVLPVLRLYLDVVLIDLLQAGGGHVLPPACIIFFLLFLMECCIIGAGERDGKGNKIMAVNINREHSLFINWMPPLIKILKEKGGSATAKEVSAGIAAKMKVSDSELSARHEKSGQLIFNNQVYWAKMYLSWEGLVTVSKRGIWVLTDAGWKSSLDYDEAFALVAKWIKIHRDTRKSKDSDITIEIERENETSREESLSLLDIIKKVTSSGFEHLCGRLLREYDFEDIKITKRSHDGGIDGTAILKLNPFVNMSVYFQCKKYDRAVPISHIREFIGVLATEQNGADRGLFITTGTLPKSAYELERKNTTLELIDGEKLVEKIEKAEIGVIPRMAYDPDMAFFGQYMQDGMN